MRLPEKVSEYIDSKLDYLVDATVRFLRVPSESGSEGEVAKVLLEELEEAGFDAFIDRVGNVIGVLKGDS
ncbi:MAG: hypothetical protein QXO23_06330, partial [Candidatus Methanomethyliaceae archaeon]